MQAGGPPILLGGIVTPRCARRAAGGRVDHLVPPICPGSRTSVAVPGGGGDAGRDPDAVRIVMPGVIRPAPRATGPGRRAAAAVGQLRADPRGRRVARRAGRDRAVLRPELGSADRLALGEAAGSGGPGRGDPRRAGARRGVSFVMPGRPGRPGPRGGRWRRPRCGWPRRACRGCWTRAHWPFSAR